jgi:hypothetical protein
VRGGFIDGVRKEASECRGDARGRWITSILSAPVGFT